MHLLAITKTRSCSQAHPFVAAHAVCPCSVFSQALTRKPGSAYSQHRSQQCLQAQRKCIIFDLHDQLTPYEQAWEWQKRLVNIVAEASLESDSNSKSSSGSLHAPATGAHADACDFAILLQHPPVYTLGTGSTSDHVKFDPATHHVPLIRTERGGEVTYHGPGQLVLYPIMDLRAHTPDLHLYLRNLEEVVIRALESASGLVGGREEGLTGVWVEGAKVAAIGVRAKRWVTYHGLALNVTPDLSPFSDIVPCGIADRPVSSVRRLLAAQEHMHAQEGDPYLDPALAALDLQAVSPMTMLDRMSQQQMAALLAATGSAGLSLHDNQQAIRPLAAGCGRGPSQPQPSDDVDDDVVLDPFAPSPGRGASAVAAADCTVLSPSSAQQAPLTAARGSCSPHIASAASTPTPITQPGQGPAQPAVAVAGPAGSSGSLYEVLAEVSLGGRTLMPGARDPHGEALLQEYACALKEAFAEVFGLQLVYGQVWQLERLQHVQHPSELVPMHR